MKLSYYDYFQSFLTIMLLVAQFFLFAVSKSIEFGQGVITFTIYNGMSGLNATNDIVSLLSEYTKSGGVSIIVLFLIMLTLTFVSAKRWLRTIFNDFIRDKESVVYFLSYFNTKACLITSFFSVWCIDNVVHGMDYILRVCLFIVANYLFKCFADYLHDLTLFKVDPQIYKMEVIKYKGETETMINVSGVYRRVYQSFPVSHEMASTGSVRSTGANKNQVSIYLKSGENSFEWIGNGFLAAVRLGGRVKRMLFTSKHVIDHYAFVTIVIDNKKMDLPVDKFICKQDVAFFEMSEKAVSILGLQALEIETTNLSRDTCVVRYILKDGSYKISDAQLSKDEGLYKGTFTHYGSTQPGCSGCPVLQNGKVIGVHGGAIGEKMCNWFTPLTYFSLRQVTKKQKIKVEGEAENSFDFKFNFMESSMPSDDYVEDEEDLEYRYSQKYDYEDLFGYRGIYKNGDKIKDLDQNELDVLGLGSVLWEKDTFLFRQYERDLNDLSEQGYNPRSPEVKAIIAEYNRKISGYESNIKRYESYTADGELLPAENFQLRRDALPQQTLKVPKKQQALSKMEHQTQVKMMGPQEQQLMLGVPSGQQSPQQVRSLTKEQETRLNSLESLIQKESQVSPQNQKITLMEDPMNTITLTPPKLVHSKKLSQTQRLRLKLAQQEKDLSELRSLNQPDMKNAVSSTGPQTQKKQLVKSSNSIKIESKPNN